MKLAQANVLELAPVLSRTATLTGSAVDTRALSGVAQVILMSTAATAGSSPTLNVKLTHCDTSGGSYTDVTGATFAEVTNADTTQMIAVNADALKRYVKVVGTLGGTSTPTFAYGVALVGINHAGRNASQAV
jgi:hypothetical protein